MRQPGGSHAEGEPLYRHAHVLMLGALGDILGSSMEGTPLAMRNGDRLDAGYLTDDTLLTIATAQSIAEQGRVDPESIAAALLATYRRGVPGLGSSTLGAMQALAAGQHWALAGLGGDRAAGNGAAIRIAPVALVTSLAESEGRRLLRDVARITHHNDEATTGALAFGMALQLAMDDAVTRTTAIGTLADALPDTVVRDRLIAASKFDGAPSEAIAALGSSGYVAESVPLAIWLGLSDWATPLEPLRFAALHAEDADSVASMTGQILGARGYEISEGVAGERLDPGMEHVVRTARQVGNENDLPRQLWRLEVKDADPLPGDRVTIRITEFTPTGLCGAMTTFPRRWCDLELGREVPIAAYPAVGEVIGATVKQVEGQRLIVDLSHSPMR